MNNSLEIQVIMFSKRMSLNYLADIVIPQIYRVSFFYLETSKYFKIKNLPYIICNNVCKYNN